MCADNEESATVQHEQTVIETQNLLLPWDVKRVESLLVSGKLFREDDRRQRGMGNNEELKPFTRDVLKVAEPPGAPL